MQFCAWYPITPASSLAESFNEYLPMLRKDPETGKYTYAVVQAEDELAAIGMAIGAGWGGLRSMTSTSGPGLSLMTEYLGLAYYAEVPVVVWDVQRVGPSTGLPTRTAQGDITQIYFVSHGDTQMVMLFPGSVNECFEFGWKAFDLAERLQTPVFVLSDLDFGMNQWMTKPFEYPATPMDRGKVLWEEDIQRIIDQNGTDKLFKGQWGRYLDVDGDGIPYRTVPGNRHPRSAYFTRGTGHNEYASYSEVPRGVGAHARPDQEEMRDRPHAGAQAGDRERKGRRDRPDLLRLHRAGRLRGAPHPGAEGHRHRQPAHQGHSLHPRSGGVHRTPQAQLRGRAEPRRADAPAAVPGNPAERRQSHFPFAYRRPAADR